MLLVLVPIGLGSAAREGVFSSCPPTRRRYAAAILNPRAERSPPALAPAGPG